MKDLCGNDVKIGDVVVTYISGECKGLVKGVVIGFTEKNIRVEVSYNGYPVTHLRGPGKVALYDR